MHAEFTRMADSALEQWTLPLGGRHEPFRWLTGALNRHHSLQLDFVREQCARFPRVFKFVKATIRLTADVSPSLCESSGKLMAFAVGSVPEVCSRTLPPPSRVPGGGALGRESGCN